MLIPERRYPHYKVAEKKLTMLAQTITTRTWKHTSCVYNPVKDFSEEASLRARDRDMAASS